MATTYQLISSNVLTSSAASVTFSSIPATYTDLVLRYSVRDDSANTYGAATIKFNGSSTGYSHTDLRTLNGTSASSSQASSQTEDQLIYSVNGGGTTANTFANSELYIPNYAGSANKCYSGDFRPENNTTAGGRGPGVMASLWSNTSAITSFVLTPTFGTNFVAGSTFHLYGVFKANVSGAPSAPTGVTATDGGTGTTASVAFTPAGQTASLYTVTSSPGSFTATGMASPVTVAGLSSGTAYTFSVVGANPLGVSASGTSGSLTLTERFGYVAAGGVSSNNNSASVEKISLSTNTRSSSTALSSATSLAAGISNPSTAGYIVGGRDGANNTPYSNKIRKILFSDDSTSTVSATLSSERWKQTGLSNYGSNGYSAGGYSTADTTWTATIDRLVFANDTRSGASSSLSTGREDMGGLTNSGTAGYLCGGGSSATQYLATIVKFVYSGETNSALSATLTAGITSMGAVSNSGTAGYIISGASSSYFNTIQEVTYSTDTRATLAATARSDYYLASFASSGSAGYVAAGTKNAYSTWVDKFNFSTKAYSTDVSTLSVGKTYSTGVQSST